MAWPWLEVEVKKNIRDICNANIKFKFNKNDQSKFINPNGMHFFFRPLVMDLHTFIFDAQNIRNRAHMLVVLERHCLWQHGSSLEYYGLIYYLSYHLRLHTQLYMPMVGAKQPVLWFLGGKVAVIQQETTIWVGLPSQSTCYLPPYMGMKGIHNNDIVVHFESVGLWVFTFLMDEFT